MMFSKVKAAGVGAGSATILAMILIAVLKSFGVELDQQTALLLAGALITIATIVAGWFKIERVGSYK